MIIGWASETSSGITTNRAHAEPNAVANGLVDHRESAFTNNARAGGFPGAQRILDEFANGALRRRVGLRPQGRAPVRAHAALFRDELGAATIGTVTSGGFGPSLDAPVAMGYVSTRCAQPGTPIFAEVRGKRLPIAVSELPFVTPHYKRG